MASISAVQSTSATLSGTTQDVVTITGATGKIAIVNQHASTGMHVHVGDSDPGSIDANDEGVYFIPPASEPFYITTSGWMPVIVRVLGNGNVYSINGMPRG